ncbi:MAG: rRNA ((966)-N(2))-methyltransferase RsmD [Rickettsiaceae bacterium]|jgi:16S rRNA (guanine966-N2)-methyltransferase|nr:rRNA ((966)-N(2))-methyltransferase RsmD [Rickettsiaceae bacterium]
MRIISGKHRGRKLVDCSHLKTLRPTSDKNRENLFNIISSSKKIRDTGFELQNSNLLDVFSGSGAVSFEALSRGAKSASLIDNNREHLEVAKENAHLLKEENLEYFCLDISKSAFKNQRQYNLIFIDPPYHKNLAAIAFLNLKNAGWIAPNAVVIIEHSPDENLEELEKILQPLEQRKYKDTIFSFYQNPPQQN